MKRIGFFPLAFFALLALAPRVSAQELSPRFGLGFNTLITTADGFDFGLGIRGRASAPVNADLSVAVDLGFTGFILGGRDDASYVFDPQVSAIVTLPFQGDRAPYVIGGIGAYAPISDNSNSDSGPTLHLGVGWVQALNETTLFYEVNPALLIGETDVSLLLPFRLGIIF